MTVNASAPLRGSLVVGLHFLQDTLLANTFSLHTQANDFLALFYYARVMDGV